VRVQLLAFSVNQDVVPILGVEMKFSFAQPESTASSRAERVLIAAVLVAMLLSLIGYMHA
jgi:hypothetical protein